MTTVATALGPQAQGAIALDKTRTSGSTAFERGIRDPMSEKLRTEGAIRHDVLAMLRSMTVPIIERLAERRATVGLTQADVAGRMRTSQSVIARLEAGGRDPRISTLERYAEAVGAGLEVRVPVGPLPMSAARLAERVGGRLARGSEPSTATFREVIQFIDDVKGRSDDETRAMLRPVPPSTGDRRWDAMVAAAAEWVAGLHGIPAPRWTKSPSRKVAAPGWVITPHVRLHDLVRANTPGEFARHGVYIDRDSLASV